MFEGQTSDEQANIFHIFLRNKLDLYFPEKEVKISSLDKKWFSPALKILHRKMLRAFHHNRLGAKFRNLKNKFKKAKRRAIQNFYEEFVTDLKSTNPGKWYRMAKKIGAVDQMNESEIRVESLAGLTNIQAAQKVAQHFAAISMQYKPIDTTHLPCYLPAPAPPQVEEYEVYQRIKHINKTRSTLPIDI